MGEESELKKSIVSEVLAEIESTTAEQEKRRFRSFYVIVGVVSFIGIGVITQLLDFYASKAVNTNLTEIRQEFTSAKLLSQLLTMAATLDISESFTDTHRDAVVALLSQAKSNSMLRAEPAFTSLLEQILDSFAASDNPFHVSRIYDMYEDECLMTRGIAITLIQHYAREYLACTDIDDPVSKKNYEKFTKLIEAVRSHHQEGMASAFASLGAYRKNACAPTARQKKYLRSCQRLDTEAKSQFLMVIDVMSDVKLMTKKITPTIARVASVTSDFKKEYESELNDLRGDVGAIPGGDGANQSEAIGQGIKNESVAP